MKTVEEIARELVLIMYQHDAFDDLDTLEQFDWMRLAHHVKNRETYNGKRTCTYGG